MECYICESGLLKKVGQIIQVNRGQMRGWVKSIEAHD